MVEVRHLRYFVAVADELHFGRAAERLHMSQSPLSHQIRQLERELGVDLIVRAHHVIGLTDAGQALLDVAQDIIERLDRVPGVVGRAGRGEVGTLTVGYVSEVTADLLPVGLAKFKERFPDVNLELLNGTTGPLLHGLRCKELDVAFVRAPSVIGEMNYRQLIVESLMAAVPKGHFASQDDQQLADLADEDFVMPTLSAAEGLRRDIDRECRAAGFTARVRREAFPLTTVLLFVAAGAGVALVPASVANQYPVPGIDYAHLKGPVPVTTAGVAWRPDDRSTIVANFLDVIDDIAQDQAGSKDIWTERQVSEEPRVSGDGETSPESSIQP
ncbi:MAG TPA: LysR family transcriptional regulator [Acidimicrobiales bacterium]|nr:LysR family transcriptional regulator [Acidimicrobiales bacterium]